MFWSSLIYQNRESEIETCVMVSSVLRFEDESSVPLLPFACCSQRDDGQIHQRPTGACWVRSAVAASRSGPRPAATPIGPSTWTSGTCRVWAACWAPHRPLLCRERPCTEEMQGLVQGSFALPPLLTHQLSACPGVSSQFSLLHILHFNSLPMLFLR